MHNHSSIKRSDFLKDVLICSLGAYGGPEAHYGIFTDQMVTKKKYLTEEDLIELVALNSILPGPTSTQTIVSIGYKMGGPSLAFLTMVVWALPVLIMMTALSFLYGILASQSVTSDVLKYIGPMAVGFILLAAYKIGKKVVKDKLTVVLWLLAALITYFFHTPWVFPVVLIAGGIASAIESGEKDLFNHVKINPPWAYLAAFGVFAFGSLALATLTKNHLIELFEAFYRYGYLVFGGGQVVIPVMFSELVDLKGFMTSGEFLTGYGLVQGLPGPMFSFSAYAGGMAARGHGILYQIAGAALSGLGIFLPGVLLIFFVYPVWEKLKEIKAIKVALRGINAVAGGLIAVAAIILTQKSGLAIDNLLVTGVTVILLWTKKIPAPIIVLASIILGFVTAL